MNIIELREKQIYDVAKSLLNDYGHLLSGEDVEKINLISDDKDDIKEREKLLTPIVKKIWDEELKSGNYIVVSWNKRVNAPSRNNVTFATLSTRDDVISFCDSDVGIEYEISYDALFGALPKDGATIIEDISRKGPYTIGELGDKVINSYNGATRLITPKQLLDTSQNTYMSKHNELILNSKMIKEIGPYKKGKEL